ncbi:HK97 family phage prohead protease [Planobispora siamensis]|uniref:Prohead serine protease domain-containing protein n=1 Tax=Planobispora siamensis TaxID=936338 RepID=A0A8J3SJG6_9ACTN|nr:HK97 family phage prohead protease [Planobispora siamensis]GIH95422.1 hypothetical protein Psi01_60520 [Planobispora siamensis]
MRLEIKTATAAADTELLGADDETGVVEAIVSVTGVVDSDNDVIEPGVYAESLARRHPKGIFSHDWKKWASRTEVIEEWLPGDPRLPKTTKNGQPWPAQAGALYVKTRYNLDTTTGRDAYHDVKFFSEVGQCEWSIGYRVPRGKGVRGKDGIRRIKGIDLFEYSPVLFGANSQTGTLAVKAIGTADGDDAAYEPIEVKAADSQDRAPVQDPGAGGEADAASSADADPAGEDEPVDEAELHAAVAQLDEAELTEGAAHAPVDDPDPEPQGGADDDPADSDDADDHSGDGPQDEAADSQAAADSATVPDSSDAPQDGPADGTKGGAPGVADTPADAAAVARLKRWYIRGEGAAKIRWNTPGAFDRCVRIASQHMPPEKAKGFCANVHKAATGRWPGANRDGKDAGQAVESTRGLYLPDSYEERRDALRELAAKMLGVPISHTDVVATWMDRVVVTTLADGGVKSFELPYTASAGGGLLVGQPVPVEVSVWVDGDADAPLPYAAMIEEAADGLKTLLRHQESKAGRVLSTTNAKRLVAAVEQIVMVLKAAGLSINDKPRVEEQESAPEAPDSTAPSARAVKDARADADQVVVVNEQMQARVAEILAAAKAVQPV